MLLYAVERLSGHNRGILNHYQQSNIVWNKNAVQILSVDTSCVSPEALTKSRHDRASAISTDLHWRHSQALRNTVSKGLDTQKVRSLWV